MILNAARLPLLITGITGVAGFNGFHFLHDRYPGQVIGIRPRRTWRLRGAGVIAQDAEDAAGMQALFDRYGFRSVLNCVGNCALKSCELDPTMAHRVNVVSAHVLAGNIARHGCRLVHLSSDLVYSGKGQGGYVETDSVDPVTVYGKTMVQAEELLLSRCPPAAILRISLPMGPSFNHHAGAIDWIQSRFRAGRPATLYFDEIRSCTYCDDLNDVFEKLLTLDEAGVFHCGSPRPITLYQIAQVVNRVGDFQPELLRGCPRIEAGPIPPRAGNCSMNSSKLVSALGYQPFEAWPRGDELLPTDLRWHFDRPVEELRSHKEIARRLYRPLHSPPKPILPCK
ncbi:MAG: sugar nucleotide-binding protein [Planctomycetes bacterium]|nr:sugar nucleotide-binding protein [Planctomycetota bacterium]